MKPGEYFYWNTTGGDIILERVISKEEYIADKGSLPTRTHYVLCETVSGVEGVATGTIGYIEETVDMKFFPVANPEVFKILFGKKG